MQNCIPLRKINNKKMITAENYHTETTHISKSGLDKINITPSHYYHYYLNPKRFLIEEKKESIDLFIGRVFHCALLEPQEYTKRYFILDKKIDRRTKEGKEMWFRYMKAAKGKELVKKEIHEKVMWMLQSVRRNPIAKKLFMNGTAEEIHTAICPQTGVACKIRTDWRTNDNIIVDLKSALDASCVTNGLDNETNEIYKGFPKHFFNFRYDVQDAFYSDIFTHHTGNPPKAFVFVAVEKTPPFEVGLFYLSESDKNNARDKYLDNLNTYKICKKNNSWPGYPKEIIKIQTLQT